VLLTIAFPLLFATVTATHWSRMSFHERADRHPLDIALAGVNVAQLAIAVLGVLVITGEYSTGMIRATFIAVPKRLPVLWAKTLVFAVVTLVLMLPAVVIAFFASRSILSRHHASYAWSHPHVARAVIGAALYLVAVAVLSLALGAIVRNTAGGISAFAAVFFVLPPLMNVLPTSWNNAISPYLPTNAGRAILTIRPEAHTLAPWTGLGLLCAYAAATLAVAAVLLVRRDT
jgi:ABC-type transport system involved in multi-copper enzyme maturation permease subunit